MRLLPTCVFVVLGVFTISCHVSPNEKSQNEERDLAVEKVSLEEVFLEEQWCAFELSEADVETYLSVAYEADAHEFNASAIIAPCRYEGSAKIEGVMHQWRIYAGGAGYFYTAGDDTVHRRYLCKHECRTALPNLQ